MTESITPHPYLCSELVSIFSTRSNRDSEVVSGNLEAIGEQRALVLTEVPLRPGSQISIDAHANVLKGVVERCSVDAPLGCFIEVRLEPESWWSEQWFKPEHLLAVGAGKRVAQASKVLTLENPSVTENFLRVDYSSRAKFDAGHGKTNRQNRPFAPSEIWRTGSSSCWRRRHSLVEDNSGSDQSKHDRAEQQKPTPVLCRMPKDAGEPAPVAFCK